MRSKVALVTLGALLCFGGASAALAKESTHKFVGKVEHVDTAAKTLAAKSPGASGKRMTFSLTSGARVMSGTRVETLAALKPGDRVSVTYSTRGMMNEAERVELLPSSSAAEKPMKKY